MLEDLFKVVTTRFNGDGSDGKTGTSNKIPEDLLFKCPRCRNVIFKDDYKAVNMVCQKGKILLSIGVQTLSLRNNIPDILMILLNMRLLPGCLRITVKDLRAVGAIYRAFHFKGVLELAAIVS